MRQPNLSPAPKNHNQRPVLQRVGSRTVCPNLVRVERLEGARKEEFARAERGRSGLG